MRRALTPLVLLAALLATAPLWRFGAGGGAVIPAHTANEERPGTGAAALRSEPGSAGEGPIAREELEVATPRPVEPDPREAALHGRLLLSGGVPAVGVEVHLRGSEANSARVARHGSPRDWRDLAVESDANGRFELRFVPPQAFQFYLDAHLDGHAPVSWRWSRLAEGVERDLGDVVLERGGAIEARVVRPDGSSAGTEWRVRASAVVPSSSGGRTSVRRRGELDAARGIWLITDLLPGPVSVSASRSLADGVDHVTVEVIAGEIVTCELLHGGSDGSDRIVVQTFTSPIYPVDADPAHIWLTGGPLAAPLPAGRQPNTPSHVFDGLAPDDYTVVIDDPRFERFERTGVRPGTVLDALLTGRSAVRLELVDRKTGAPVTNYSLAIRAENVNFRPDTFPLVGKGEEPPAEGRFGSLPPLDYTMLVEPEGYPPEVLPVHALAAGEERLVRVELSRHGGLAGTVRWEGARTPVAGAPVELYRTEIRERRVEWWTIWGDGEKRQHLLGETVTDSEGRFRIPTSAGGPLLLRAVGGPALHVLREVAHAAGTDQDGVELVIPASAFVMGRLLAPPGADLSGLVARLGAAGSTGDVPAEQWMVGWDEFLETEVAADGTFRLGPLKPGGARLALLRTGAAPGGGAFAPATLLERVLSLDGPGEHPVELDLLASWPGELVVDLRVGAEPAGGLSVSLQLIEGEPLFWGISTRADHEGSAQFSPLAGTYRVQVRERGNWWTTEHPLSLTVRPGERAEVVVDVAAARGELRVLDGATGAPLVAGEVRLLRVQGGEPRAREQRKQTDRDGRIALLLPEGTLWIARNESNGPLGLILAELAELPRVEWTADGPVPGDVSLP